MMLNTEKKNPNIVFILADDMGYGDLGCYNAKSQINTPNMDKLANLGVMFTDAHSSSAVCTPSRYSILTGRYCWKTPLKKFVFFNYEQPLIESNRLTVASILKNVGYNTACIGKWHLGLGWKAKPGTEIDFNRSYPWDRGNPDEKIEDNVDFTAEITGGPNDLGFEYAFYTSGCSTDQPPYCFIENKQCLRMSKAKKAQPKGSTRTGMVADGWDNEIVDVEFTKRAKEYLHSQKDNENSNPFFLYLSLSSPHSPHMPPPFIKGVSNAGPRGDLVSLVDWSVGEIMSTLDELNLHEDTLFIVTSDNGPLVGSIVPPDAGEWNAEINNGHRSAGLFRGYKGEIYEGGHRVPFIARWPEHIQPDITSNTPICLTDLLATFAGITGASFGVEDDIDSMSMLSAMTGNDDNSVVRDYIIHHSGNGVFSIRKGKWKMIFESKGNGWDEGPVEGTDGQLFNMETDAFETEDVWNERQRLTSELELLFKNTIEGYR